MTTVGEPIEPEVWRWYHKAVGKDEAVIVDTWWQTETGGFLGSSLPALKPMKPGSCGPAVIGIYPAIFDENGEEVPDGRRVTSASATRGPASCQTVWGQPERFISVYYEKYNKNPDSKDWRDWPYFAGDGAVRAADGYYRILGRVDDVINVAGHRLGTKEIESAALTVEEVAEAAAVPVVNDIRGRAVEVYVSLKPGYTASQDMVDKVSRSIEVEIGKIARPKNVWIVSDMPKTRSGKIMRRVIAAVSNFTDTGDVTTLANPEIVDDIRREVQSAKVARGDVPGNSPTRSGPRSSPSARSSQEVRPRGRPGFRRRQCPAGALPAPGGRPRGRADRADRPGEPAGVTARRPFRSR